MKRFIAICPACKLEIVIIPKNGQFVAMNHSSILKECKYSGRCLPKNKIKEKKC